MKYAFRLLAVLAAPLALALATPLPADAGEAIDRIKSEKLIRLGIRTDAPPFSSVVDGQPGGFSVDLCVLMAEIVAKTSNIEGLSGKLVTVDTADRFDAVANGEIDVLCGATTATLSRREKVDFTLPTFATGIGAVVRKDSSALVQEVLITGGAAALSAAAIEEALKNQKLGVRAQTTASEWLKGGRIASIEGVMIEEVADHAEGLARVASGDLTAYFADRAILLGQLGASDSKDDLTVSVAQFTHEPYALAIPLGDQELRLALDRALSYLYRKGLIYKVYERHFGKPGAEAALFYTMTAMPE